MARLQPFFLPRPLMPSLHRDLVEPSNGQTLSLTLQKMEPHEQFLAAELGESMHKKYVTGDPDEGIARASFPLVGKKPVELTHLQCLTAAQIVIMQRAPDGEDPYGFEDVIAISYTMPAAWRGIMGMVAELNNAIVPKTLDSGNSPKNANGASTSPISDSPCTTPTPILTLSSETTPLEEAQTPGKEPV